jgi:hypothetical protein
MVACSQLEQHGNQVTLAPVLSMRIVKLVVSLFLSAGDSIQKVLCRIVGKSVPATCVVLYYHGIDRHQRAQFDRQMSMLCRYCTPLSVDDMDTLPPAGRFAVVTFDDAFDSVIENALPTLTAHGIPATIFVPTGWIGRRPGWGNYSRNTDCSDSVMEEKDIRDHGSNHLLKFGAHSVTHCNFTRNDDVTARSELRDSRIALERIVGGPVTLFSFPHGAFDERHLRMARVEGYTRVFSISPSVVRPGDEEFVVGRCPADPSDSSVEFKLKLCGAYRWIDSYRQWRARRRPER